jgi:histidinol-phosphate aminotransferase
MKTISENIPVRINRNENAWGCSPTVLRALQEMDLESVCRYPDEAPLAAMLARQLSVETANVQVTAAGDEAIRMVIDGLTVPGDTVSIPEPEFPIFRWCAESRNRYVVTVPLNEDFRYNTADIIQTARNVQLLVLVSPHNPSGCTLSLVELETILEAVKDIPVLMDEAYGEFAGMTYVPLIRRYDNLLVLKTFSKAYGLAGMRLGSLVGSPLLLARCAEAQMPYAVGTPSVVAGLSALSDPAFIRAVQLGVVRNRNRLRQTLGRRGIPTLASGGNFVSAWFGDEASYGLAQLADNGIMVRNIGNEHRMPGWLRFTVGTKEEMDHVEAALSESIQPEIILFDMDGVLVNVRASYRATIAKTVETLTGQAVAPEEIQELKDTGGFNCDWDLTAQLVRQKGGQADRDRIMGIFQATFRGNNFDGLIQNDRPLVEPDMLAQLAACFRLGVVTGRPGDEARYTLARFGLDRYFPVIISNDDIPEGGGKPRPDGLILAASMLAADRGFYVGDTGDDMRAALRARLVPVGILPPDGGRTQKRSLSRSGAAVVLDSVNRLKEWIYATGNN